ncbi:MAG: hypothetical protein ACXVA9_09010 [Bdellovibrionales bacterium]
MALKTNIPPQAYTRDTLVKAIEWVSSQPPSVRERASSADLVVSFYLQACRKAAAQMEAPVSGANFKSDLKHLAQDLKQFEEPTAPPPMGRLSTHDYFSPPEPIFKPEPVQTRMDIPLRMEPPRMEPVRMEPPRMEAVQARIEPVQAPPPPPMMEPPRMETPRIEPSRMEIPPPPKATSGWPVDSRSQHAARELQQRLNLSSETEALRMLVTLGAEAAKKLFP